MKNLCSEDRRELTVHILIKDINRGTFFYEISDYQEFLVTAKNLLNRYGCQLHTFSLLPDHVHLLLSADPYLNTDAVINLLCREYSRYLNFTYRRSKNRLVLQYSLIELAEEDSALVYYRYLELTPVRTGLVDHPAEYPWSGFGYNAMGEDCGLLVGHPAYLALGLTEQARRESYRESFEQRYRIRLALAAG